MEEQIERKKKRRTNKGRVLEKRIGQIFQELGYKVHLAGKVAKWTPIGVRTVAHDLFGAFDGEAIHPIRKNVYFQCTYHSDVRKKIRTIVDLGIIRNGHHELYIIQKTEAKYRVFRFSLFEADKFKDYIVAEIEFKNKNGVKEYFKRWWSEIMQTTFKDEKIYAKINEKNEIDFKPE